MNRFRCLSSVAGDHFLILLTSSVNAVSDIVQVHFVVLRLPISVDNFADVCFNLVNLLAFIASFCFGAPSLIGCCLNLVLLLLLFKLGLHRSALALNRLAPVLLHQAHLLLA